MYDDGSGGKIVVFNKEGVGVFIASTDEDGGIIGVRNGADERAAQLYVDEQGHGFAGVYDKEGRNLAALRAGAQGQGACIVRDPSFPNTAGVVSVLEAPGPQLRLVSGVQAEPNAIGRVMARPWPF